MSCGFVIVSHSAPLAEALRELAQQMMPGAQVPLACAAGTANGEIGTDAMMILAAIEQVGAAAEEVLVFTDLGSAILSAQTAHDFADPELAARTRLSRAPLVEGVVGAVAKASLGHDMAEVDLEASRGLAPKLALIAHDNPAATAAVPPMPALDDAGDPFDPTLPRLEYDLQIMPDKYQRAPSLVEENARVDIARARASAAVQGLAQESDNDVVVAILTTIIALVNDRGLGRLVRADIEAGASAFSAVESRMRALAAKVAEADTAVLREQAVDLHVVSRLILGALVGDTFAGIANARDIHTDCVLVLPELDAVSAALLRPSHVRGVEVKAYSHTGHGPRIAAALGVPITAV